MGAEKCPAAIGERGDRSITLQTPYPSGLTGGSTLNAACRSPCGQLCSPASGTVPNIKSEWALRSSRRDAGDGGGARKVTSPLAGEVGAPAPGEGDGPVSYLNF
ncbi:hypothetical protein GCM10011587_16530 [Pyruvatibacter mobilis]|nr:hypothetical protein GCM10011587_16530 [Pyruvatibacter mobilis]